ncbi:MAG TPA: heavy metal translocating P-type ATPase [Candidatus Saccharimonadales bacterium]|nr:heavy metal translocating P-type ATPase [Candidatus Saccharimonadales bacterium]
MKKIFRFFKQYSLFSLALVGAAVALGLDLAGLDKFAHWLIIAIAVIELAPLLWGMIQDIRQGTYGVDILAATAIVTSLLLGEYWAAIVIVLMLTGGESLEDYAERRASNELDALLSRAPQKARILRGKSEVEVKASEVQVGDKLVLRPGEIVPVDAVILEGTSSFDESSLTGESLPQVKSVNETILSGSLNSDGAIVAKALHSAEDSQYEQIIKLVRSAQHSKAPFVRLADKYAIPFTILSFGIAGTVWAFSGDPERFLQVLVVATPCPLILAAPIAIISGMSRASRQGIIIKTGTALEQLATAKTFAFDKTGTLTRGELQVASVTAYGPYEQHEVLAWAAALEQSSNHVLAQAIVTKAQADKLSIKKANHVRELAGNGLVATLSGKKVIVGRLSMLQEYDITLPGTFSAKDVTTTAAFVAINGELAGVITFTDELREETKPTLERLRKLGMDHIVMITGDNKATARAMAKSTGIKDYYAEALPGDKIRVLEQLTPGPVAFVGDGVNDAPVLTASDVGIALGARGSAAASQSADVVIMQDNLGHVADGRAIAKHTFFIAKQSIFIGIGLSVILMAIFATGKFKPIYGAAIQEVVDIVVILNALRAHGTWKKAKKA